jgi:hypothetical protein
MPRIIVRATWDKATRGPVLPFDSLPYIGGGGYSAVGIWPPEGTTCLVAVDCSAEMADKLSQTLGCKPLESIDVGSEKAATLKTQPTKVEIQAELTATKVPEALYRLAGGGAALTTAAEAPKGEAIG